MHSRTCCGRTYTQQHGLHFTRWSTSLGLACCIPKSHFLHCVALKQSSKGFGLADDQLVNWSPARRGRESNASRVQLPQWPHSSGLWDALQKHKKARRISQETQAHARVVFVWGKELHFPENLLILPPSWLTQGSIAADQT